MEYPLCIACGKQVKQREPRVYVMKGVRCQACEYAVVMSRRPPDNVIPISQGRRS